MNEPMKTLYLDAVKTTGDCELAIRLIEERLTVPEVKQLTEFAAWLGNHELTVSHDTIDARFKEFTTGIPPLRMNSTYKFAARTVGLGLLLLAFAGVGRAQDIEHAPTAAQCIADSRLWDSQAHDFYETWHSNNHERDDELGSPDERSSWRP
jgi:hypothetical protein